MFWENSLELLKTATKFDKGRSQDFVVIATQGTSHSCAELEMLITQPVAEGTPKGRSSSAMRNLRRAWDEPNCLRTI